MEPRDEYGKRFAEWLDDHHTGPLADREDLAHAAYNLWRRTWIAAQENLRGDVPVP